MEQTPLTPIALDQYGAVLAELRQAVCDPEGAVKKIANEQLGFGAQLSRLEAKVDAFVDPITRRARASLIFGGAAVGGFMAGILVEMAVRLLAASTGHSLAMLGG